MPQYSSIHLRLRFRSWKVSSESGRKYGYSNRDIGGYLLPVERGRAIYAEFDLPCDLEDEGETESVKRIWNEASETLIDKGAYFEMPYGRWADMVYSRYNSICPKVEGFEERTTQITSHEPWKTLLLV